MTLSDRLVTDEQIAEAERILADITEQEAARRMASLALALYAELVEITDSPPPKS